jgi:hypothetical protein
MAMWVIITRIPKDFRRSARPHERLRVILSHVLRGETWQNGWWFHCKSRASNGIIHWTCRIWCGYTMLYVECSISASISHLIFDIFRYFRLVISSILSCPLDPANTLISAEALWQAPEIPGPGEAAMFLWDIYGYIICIKYRLYIYINMMYVYIHTHTHIYIYIQL